MMTGAQVRKVAAMTLALALFSSRAAADQGADDDASTSAIEEARQEFLAATNSVRNARWGEALAAFERSAALHPHPLTTYNIGACERALGQYTRARASLRAALEDNERRGGKDLAASIAARAQEYLSELEDILAHVEITLVPADAELLVDGKPLSGHTSQTTAPSLASGADAGRSGGHAMLVLDPGAHLFSVSRGGFARAVVSKTLMPHETVALTIDLERLPATLAISANEPSAVVTVGNLDVGTVPVQIVRPGGSYPVLVRKPGYIPYSTTVQLNAGQETRLRATLVKETRPLYTKPWFWGAVAAAVGAAVATTYVLARPDPSPPPPDGGGLNWVVSVGNGR